MDHAGGTFRCPANQKLTPHEQRRETDGSLRIVYGASIRSCRPCPKREQCQWQVTRPRSRARSACSYIRSPSALPHSSGEIGVAENTGVLVCNWYVTNGLRWVCRPRHHLRPPWAKSFHAHSGITRVSAGRGAWLAMRAAQKQGNSPSSCSEFRKGLPPSWACRAVEKARSPMAECPCHALPRGGRV